MFWNFYVCIVVFCYAYDRRNVTCSVLLQTLRLFTVICGVYCRRYVFSPSCAVFKTDVTSFHRHFQCFIADVTSFHLHLQCFIADVTSFHRHFQCLLQTLRLFTFISSVYCSRYVFSPSCAVFKTDVTSFHRHLQCLIQTLRLFTVICSV